MGEKWRVTVERFDETEIDAEWVEVSTLVAERGQLARFAPGVVADALGSTTTVTMGNASATFTPVAEPELGYMTPDGPVVMAEAPKRKRRTKAEIEADRARETGDHAGETAGNRIERVIAESGLPIKVTTGLSGTGAAPFNPFAQK